MSDTQLDKRIGRYIGKVVLVKLPKNDQPRYRWIVRKRDDGRYIVRTPRTGVLIRDLDFKRNSDFGREALLPLGSTKYYTK